MKIICVGRNYAAHAKELSNAVPTEPLIFMKPDTALLLGNRDFYHPEFSKEIHFECEIVYRISKEGKHIAKKFAWDYVDGIGLGIDFTARDLQDEIKKKGHPWTLAKMFNDSAAVSNLLDPQDFPDHRNIRFDFQVNGTTRQQGHSADMIFPLEDLIAYVSQFITIKKGDLIFTGTPEGVGKVNVGDHLEAQLEGQPLLDFYVK